MVMVKAFAYGSGSAEVAQLLQYHSVDYLGVAYPDEGVDLRRNHIRTPIMVMNPSAESFETLLEYDLEPELYSMRLLDEFVHFLNGRRAKVHLKVDTGMHRLGFEEGDWESVIVRLKAHPNLEVVSVFSHLAAADEARHDDFSEQQAGQFVRMTDRLTAATGNRPLRHLLNTSGILRLARYQFEMVRLGIGLYGVNPTSDEFPLQPVVTLKSVISQIKRVPQSETIGYGRRGVAERDLKMATVAIGYADGYSRAFGNGKGKMLVHGKLAPVIGSVCMDMTMIDITGIDAEEGDEVILFGKDLPVHHLAQWIGTIPYEILTNTGDRVRRVFYAESV
jgi:alanine racemase